MGGDVIFWPVRFSFLKSRAAFFAAICLGLVSSVTAKELIRWGDSRPAQAYPPPALNNVKALSVGGLHSLALLADGTVVAWGNNDNGQTNIPPGLSNVLAIAAGDHHSLALTADGKVMAWGDNSSGQTNVPAGLSNVTAIAAGATFNVALGHDGNVTLWGTSGGSLLPPPEFTNIVKISARSSHFVAVRKDGRVVEMGGLVAIPTNLTGVVDVAAGAFFSVALKSNGDVALWGIGAGVSGGSSQTLTNAVAIGAGDAFSWALQADRSLRMTGDNQYGQLQIPAGLTNVTAISAGGIDTLAFGELLPTISVQPTNLSLFTGGAGSFGVTASGSAPLMYQWLKTGQDIPGATNNSLIIGNANLIDSGAYAVRISNPVGVISSSNALLTVRESQPVITSFSTNVTTFLGGTATLRMTVTGSLPISFRWRFGGQEIPNATNSTFFIPQAQREMAGSYDVIISNAFGVVTSPDVNFAVLSVAAWAGTQPAVTNLPTQLTNVLQVSVGVFHALAVTKEGGVIAWGRDPIQTNLPPGLTNIIAVAAGDQTSLALRSNGTVIPWGFVVNVPSSATNVVAIAAGTQHDLALRRDGTVIAWGVNSWDQTNVPPNLTNAVAIAANGRSSYALRADGTIVAWGLYSTNAVPQATNVLAISSGNEGVLALRDDGSVIAWGQRIHVPQGLTNVVAIAAGNNYDVALVSDGNLVAWGINGELLTNVPPGLKNVVQMSAGAASAMAIVNEGAPALTIFPISTSAYRGTALTLHARAIGTGKLSYQWFKNGMPIPGATNANLVLPDVLESDSGTYSISVANSLGSARSSEVSVVIQDVPPVITKDPSDLVLWQGAAAAFDVGAAGPPPLTYQWQFNETDLPNATNSILILSNLSNLSVGRYRVVVQNAFGITPSAEANLSITPLVIWGQNNAGQTNVPPGLTNVTAVSAGWRHVMALRPDGSVLCWGFNALNSTVVPPGATNVIAVAGGGQDSLALRKDGIPIAWGEYSDGKTNVPPGLSNVIQIAAGWSHNLALKSDGTITGWGYNYNGQATPPGDLHDVRAIAAGDRHSLALLTNGTIVGWGDNTYGQLSNPASLVDVKAIAAGGFFSVALSSNGLVYAWGKNDLGQTNVPPGLRDVIKIAAGHDHVLAESSDGLVSHKSRTISASKDAGGGLEGCSAHRSWRGFERVYSSGKAPRRGIRNPTNSIDMKAGKKSFFIDVSHSLFNHRDRRFFSTPPRPCGG